MNKINSKSKSSNNLPFLIGWLFLMSFIVFPFTSLLVVFELVEFNYFVNFHLPLLPKLDDFTGSDIQSIASENAKLWFALLIPYLLILVWFLIYLVLVYSNNHVIYTGQNFFKNIGYYSLFLSGLVFFSIVYATGHMRFSRFGARHPDYSLTMSIGEYSNWQMGMYLFSTGGIAALEFMILLSVFMYRKRS